MIRDVGYSSESCKKVVRSHTVYSGAYSSASELGLHSLHMSPKPPV